MLFFFFFLWESAIYRKFAGLEKKDPLTVGFPRTRKLSNRNRNRGWLLRCGLRPHVKRDKEEPCFSTFLHRFYKDTRRVQQPAFAMAVIGPGKWTIDLWKIVIDHWLTLVVIIFFYITFKLEDDSELFMSNFRSSPYHYVPSEGIAITFIVLFGLSTGKKAFFLHYLRRLFLC